MKCLIEGCDRKAKSRGLCDACYQVARKRVNGGVVTWNQLFALGLAIPAKRDTKKNAFADALKAKLAVAADAALQQPASGLVTPLSNDEHQNVSRGLNPDGTDSAGNEVLMRGLPTSELDQTIYMSHRGDKDDWDGDLESVVIQPPADEQYEPTDYSHAQIGED